MEVLVGSLMGGNSPVIAPMDFKLEGVTCLAFGSWAHSLLCNLLFIFDRINQLCLPIIKGFYTSLFFLAGNSSTICGLLKKESLGNSSLMRYGAYRYARNRSNERSVYRAPSFLHHSTVTSPRSNDRGSALPIHLHLRCLTELIPGPSGLFFKKY